MGRKKKNRKKNITSNSPKPYRYLKRNEIQICIIIIIFLIAYISIFDTKLDLNGDNAAYYILAKGLSEEKAYVMVSSLGAPPSTHWPPGYPAILAILMTFVSDSIIFLKVFNGILFIFSILILWSILKYIKVRWEIIFLTCLFLLVNSHLLRFSTIIMSEIPFLFFSLLTFYSLIKVDKTKFPFRDGYFYFMIISLVIAYHIRSIGIAVAFGILFFFLFQKRWTHLGTSIFSFVALATPWFLRNEKFGGTSYINQLIQINPYRPELGQAGLSDIFTRIIANTSRYITHEIPSGILPFISADYQITTMIDWIIGIIIFVLIIYGIIKLPSLKILFIGYLGGTFAILLLWPDVWFGIRFILPIIPILLFLFILGLYEILRYAICYSGFSHQFNPLFLLIGLILFISPVSDVRAMARQDYPPNWRNYFSIAEWVSQNTPNNSVIACRKPYLFYLKAKRYTRYYARTINELELIQDLQDNNVTHVVLANLGYASTFRNLYPAIQSQPELFEVVLHLQNPDSILLKFSRKDQ